MLGPLEGIRVVSWAQWMPAAAAAHLGDLGANVIKVEEPVHGDAFRGLANMNGEVMTTGTARNVGIETTTRSQRVMTLNLKSEKAREIFARLVAGADVFITNYSERVARKLGADYETLSAQNPGLVYASSSTYGPEGAWAGKRGFDQTAQARSGLMWAAGDRDWPEPTEIYGGVCDQMCATLLAYGILAALLARQRTGTGQRVDASLYGGMIHQQALGLNRGSLTGRIPARHSRTRVRQPLSNYYRCADGKWLLLAENQSDRFWADFCRAMDLPGLEGDPRFANEARRREHYRELIDCLDATFATRTRDEWVRFLDERGASFVFCPIFDTFEVLDDPQALANDYIVEMDHPSLGKVKVTGFPVRFSDTPASIQNAAPEFGQHTEEILGELGYTWDDIAELREQDVF